jgi:DNA-binding transcriptional LysR family regulator
MSLNVKIEHLQSFVVVAQLGSFTQAAKVLHISQPALTVQIHRLEDSLDVRLLERNTRSVNLTKVGKEILPAAQRIIRDVEELVLTTKVSQKKENAVRTAAISSVAAVILPLVLKNFYKRYPMISVQVIDAFSDRVLTLVREEEVDFGIASLTEVPSDIQMSLLFRDRLSVVCSPEHAIARQNTVQLQDLLELPLILMEAGTSNRKLIDRAFQSISQYVKPRYETARLSTALAMAEAGLGVAVLPSTYFRDKRNSSVQVKPIQHDMLCREIGIIQKVGHSVSTDAEKFMTFLKSCTRGSEPSLNRIFADASEDVRLEG